MKKILIIPILAMLLVGLLIQPGCDKDDFKFDLQNLKQSLFNVAIDQAIVFIEAEVIGPGRDTNIGYLTNLIEGWLGPLGILGNPKADGWQDVIANAYDIVAANIAEKLKAELMKRYPATWEMHYEGADPCAIGFLDHEDFQEYFDVVVAPLE